MESELLNPSGPDMFSLIFLSIEYLFYAFKYKYVKDWFKDTFTALSQLLPSLASL